jgi:hypothetical protein
MLRLLFLITVLDAEQCRILVDDYHISQIMEEFIISTVSQDTMLNMARNESLKLLYNLMLHLPKAIKDQENSLSPSLSHRSDSSYENDENISGRNSPIHSPRMRSGRLASLTRRMMRPMSRIGSPTRRMSNHHHQHHHHHHHHEAMLDPEEEKKLSPQEYLQYKVALRFEQHLPKILELILEYPLQEQDPLAPPVNHAIHALINFPLIGFQPIWFPTNTSKPFAILDRLVKILDLTISQDNLDGGLREQHLDGPLMPLLSLLHNISKYDIKARHYLRQAMLPSEFDRSKPVHQGDSLSARVIRVLTASFLTKSRTMMGELLYILFDEDGKWIDV